MDCQGAAPLERVPLFGDTSRVVGRVLDELGLQHDLRTRLDGAWKPVTLALPDRRGLLPTTLADRGRELGRAVRRAQRGARGALRRGRGLRREPRSVAGG
ncbi:MAG: hypothetical protein H6705_14520 [Myxococcales bacterium]|nr:hypothetical protein [Myxococcales bacterium]